jgi:hypothetical protein
MHEDFDIAISPSRFSRLANLKSPDTYSVTVFADGFEDITFEYSVKNYSNNAAAIDGATSMTYTGSQINIEISGLDNANVYASGAILKRGDTVISPNLYNVVANGSTRARLSLLQGLFRGTYQGSYTLSYETANNGSKPITFTVVNPVGVKLSKSDGGAATASSISQPLEISTDSAIYFVSDGAIDDAVVADFARTIVTSGRGGYSTIQEVTTTGAAVGPSGTIDAFKRIVDKDESSPYYIDLSSSKTLAAGTVGKIYKLTIIAPGFNNQIYYIKIK